MAIRSTVGSMLESAIGRERTNNLRRLERRTRNALATRIAMEPVKKQMKKPAATSPPKPANRKPRSTARPSRWRPPDPFTEHPEPIMTRHELLGLLHQKMQPRTYLEIGIRTGNSMALSRTRSIGVDPYFKID